MYEFRPPTRSIPVDRRGQDPLWSRVKFNEGYAVVKRTDGSYEQTLVVDRSRPDAAFIYTGGHVHLIDDAEAVALTAAGYGSFLTEVVDG